MKYFLISDKLYLDAYPLSGSHMHYLRRDDMEGDKIYAN